MILQKRYCILKISLLCIIFPSFLNEYLISRLIKASRLILRPYVIMWKFSLKISHFFFSRFIHLSQMLMWPVKWILVYDVRYVQ